jgi:drug/metabolite transporter (DMT)-like permease
MVRLVLILVQVLFASLAIAGRVVLPVVPPAVLVSFRILGAAIALVALNLIQRGPWIRNPKVLARLALGGLLGVTANQSLFLFGLRHTTAVNATLLVTTVPVFTVLGSLLFRTEPASPLKIGGIALAGAGAVYLVGPERLSLAPGMALGNLLILIGMVCYAGYLLLVRPVVARHDPVAASAMVMLFAALAVLPLSVPALAGASLAGLSTRTWVLVGYIVVGPTVGAYLLNLWALQRVSSNTVAAFVYLQPLFAALAAPLVLPGEQLTPRTVLAGLTIFSGLGLVLRAEQRQRLALPAGPGLGE